MAWGGGGGGDWLWFWVSKARGLMAPPPKLGLATPEFLDPLG